MTRSNYLVERNRARRAKFEPTRKAIEEEELHLAETRAKEKQERIAAWKASSAALAASNNGKTRPLPGGGPRRNRPGAERPVNEYQLEKEEEARKHAEYRALYEADMKEQLALRQQTLKQMKDDEDRQMAALNELNADAARKAADDDFRIQEENKAYLDRVRQTNEREMANQRRRRQEQDAKDAALQRLVNENSRHNAEMEERHQKNLNKMLKIQNEENHKEAIRRVEDSRQRESDEMALAVELDRRAAQAEREANQAKQDRFHREFDEAVARDKEFRRTHNYDEPEQVTRQRNELAAESYRLMRQEEALRQAQRRAEYEHDLMDQIIAHQQYAMTHIDEV